MDRLPRRIAAACHNIYTAGLKRAFGDEWIPIPVVDSVSDPQPWMRDLSGLEFSFIGKDLTSKILKHWESLAVPALREAFGAYCWVLENKPDSVVIWNDEQSVYRGIITAAKQLKIPTIELIHGNIHQAQPAHWCSDKLSDFQLGSWAYYDFHKLMEYSGTAIATGTITQDPYALDEIEKVRTTSRFELNIPEHVPVVTYLTDAVFKRTPWMDTGFSYWTFTEFMKAWQNIRKIIPGIQLIVKVHPYEKAPDGSKITPQDYSRLVEQWQTEDYTIIDDPLILALAPSDVVVGRSSSAMASALHLRIPCVRLDYEPFNHQPLDMGSITIKSPDMVLTELSELLLDHDKMSLLISQTEKGCAYYSGAQDQKSVQRTKKAIEAITDRKEVPEDCWCPLPDSAPQPRLRI